MDEVFIRIIFGNYSRTYKGGPMKRPRAFLLLAILLIASLIVSAHDTWLSSKEPTVSPGTKAMLDLTSGMAFPLLDTSIKPDRVGVARYRLNG